MLVQLYRDNYIEQPQENLTYTIYDGYFNDVLSWFNTAVQLSSGFTSDLTNLQTATNGEFGIGINNRSLRISGFFRATKTGNIRFFTTSDDASYLLINGSVVVDNAYIHEVTTNYGTINVVAGQYYELMIYYGISATGTAAFAAGFDYVTSYPPKAFTSDTDLVVSNFPYGNGTYSISASSFVTFRPFRAFNKVNPNEGWGSSGGYNTTTGVNGGTRITTTNSGNITGEWLQITLPSAIVLNSFTLRSWATAGYTPKSFAVVARNGASGNFNVIFQTNESNTLANDGNNSWDRNQTILVPINVSEAYNTYRLIIGSLYPKTDLTYNNTCVISEWELYEADNSPHITNGTGLNIFYNINPENTTSLVETASYPLLYLDASLQGLYRVSPLAFYINRPSFTTGKGDILYIASEDLFNNYNGTYRDYIQIHEKPVNNDNERKRFTQFSSDMSFLCELDGKIEVSFRRGVIEPVTWRYAMLILDVERIPVKPL